MTNDSNTKPCLQTNEVGYYNKEIIKRKQRNNKDIRQEEQVPSSSSFGLVASAPQVNPEVVEVPEDRAVSPETGQEEAEPDFSPMVKQAPTSPPAFITSQQIKRAIVQFYHNQGNAKVQERKLKIRLNCDFGQDKEENIDFIATLTTDLSNFKKYHPAESKEYIHNWVMNCRSQIKKSTGVNAYLGKFHENHGFRPGKSQVNQIEPWTACLLWYDKEKRVYRCLIKLYDWEEVFELSDDMITDKQKKTNLRAQKLWYNPLHLNLQRPMTWAQKRGLTK
jgi:hypothetical protein